MKYHNTSICIVSVFIPLANATRALCCIRTSTHANGAPDDSNARFCTHTHARINYSNLAQVLPDETTTASERSNITWFAHKVQDWTPEHQRCPSDELNLEC